MSYNSSQWTKYKMFKYSSCPTHIIGKTRFSLMDAIIIGLSNHRFDSTVSFVSFMARSNK